VVKKEQIIARIKEVSRQKRRFQSSDVLHLSGKLASRQYVSILLREMVDRGELASSGSKRYTFYALPANADLLIDKESRTLVNHGLKEHLVYEDLFGKAEAAKKLNDNAASIINFAFSEMLNNAIEHSHSEKIKVTVYREKQSLVFSVRDFGLGVYETIKTKYGLANDLEAIQELLKGKTTVAPKAHSGEGIFFTSKAVDEFVLESFGSVLRVDNLIEDVFVETRQRPLRGTNVTIRLNCNTRRHLNSIFQAYYSDPESYAFDKTVIFVKLFTMGTVYVSRSQARRLLQNIEKRFKVMVLDFDKVPTVGQAFADEIFRVFASRHPDINIQCINMNDAVEFMITRALNTAEMR
jgi:anti-sigma regulatory factor (Ser/Thr protein kinase)